MKGLNRTYLIGHIGHDPELRSSANGQPFLKLSIATPRQVKRGEQWETVADWHRVTVFGHDAEYLSKAAGKGDVLAVEAALRPNRWTDKEGTAHYDVSVVVDRILWLQSKKPKEYGRKEEAPPPPPEEGDENIPF